MHYHCRLLTVAMLVLHPSMRLAYFKNTALWDASVATRAKQLLDEIYEEYSKAPAQATPTVSTPVTSSSSSILASAILGTDQAQAETPVKSEIELYLSSIYPLVDVHGALGWWKVCTLSHSLYLYTHRAIGTRPMLRNFPFCLALRGMFSPFLV